MGCEHYQRNCLKRCEVCLLYYPCRICHDNAVSSHSFPRFETKKMKCLKCETEQDIGQYCAECGTKMGIYYCDICKLISDDPNKDIYHCKDCGICRLGKGLGIDRMHCDICGICTELEHKTFNNCRKDFLKENCAVCWEYMFDSRRPIIISMCGHALHQHCFEELIKHDSRCPVCLKSLGDMTEFNKIVDGQMALYFQVTPPSGEISLISCADCEKRSDAPFHPIYHKCAHCGSYTTTIIEIRTVPMHLLAGPNINFKRVLTGIFSVTAVLVAFYFTKWV